MTPPRGDGAGPSISVVAADAERWDDLQAVFGPRGEPVRCQCQYFKCDNAAWRGTGPQERREALRADPAGLLAYLDGEPVGWCALDRRTAYPRLRTSRVVWSGRAEDRGDDEVWCVTCFVTRVGHRRRGVSHALARAAVEHARARGASAVEGYPIVVGPGERVATGDLYVGTSGVFTAAGFTEVSRPTPRRAVMRVELR
ncbi:GNAT family N-acetyltransferase [Dactylosporangium sucinum]|uniref:N-acetyltransferase domain-containing protein n=1 Tax=Dactylosporangium sucinum TaxID=1424081 RepID=A0A917U1I2_9ACTN|nr:GNAT family N-acetyltransferase [Dactylosporangium sucinum]GGM48246.1 hypothetical protein GCM10007977_057270 [Dactylosporangium sucinum]